MWIEKLKEAFDRYIEYKDEKINPFQNEVRDVLDEFCDEMLKHRIWSKGQRLPGYQQSLSSMQGFDANRFKYHFATVITMWLRDEYPYLERNEQGEMVPIYPSYSQCKGDEWYKVVLDIFDHVVLAQKIRSSQYLQISEAKNDKD